MKIRSLALAASLAVIGMTSAVTSTAAFAQAT